MEELRKLLKNETEHLKKIRVDKVYYRDIYEYIEVCVTIKDYYHIKELEQDYIFLVNKLRNIVTEASIIPKIEFHDKIYWGWKEVDYN